MSDRVWLIGPGDKVLKCDAAGVVTYTSSDLTDDALMELAPIQGDHRGTYRPVAHPDRYLTADATTSTPGGNPCLQVYGASASEALGPDGLPGFYQRWNVGIWPDGLIRTFVPYIEQGAGHGHPWGSAGFTVVKQS